MERCILCGWVLNWEHAFNVKCAAANAEAEQIEAEVAEISTWPDPDPAETKRLMEIALDEIAWRKIRRQQTPLLVADWPPVS